MTHEMNKRKARIQVDLVFEDLLHEGKDIYRHTIDSTTDEEVQTWAEKRFVERLADDLSAGDPHYAQELIKSSMRYFGKREHVMSGLYASYQKNPLIRCDPQRSIDELVQYSKALFSESEQYATIQAKLPHLNEALRNYMTQPHTALSALEDMITTIESIRPRIHTAEMFLEGMDVIERKCIHNLREIKIYIGSAEPKDGVKPPTN